MRRELGKNGANDKKEKEKEGDVEMAEVVDEGRTSHIPDFGRGTNADLVADER